MLTHARFKGVIEAHKLRTILLGTSLSIFNAVISSLGTMAFFVLGIPLIPYQFLFLTTLFFFIGARYAGKNIFYPAIITHIFLLLMATYFLANNSFMVPEEFSEPFLTTLSRRYLHLLLELSIAIAALILGILSNKKKVNSLNAL